MLLFFGSICQVIPRSVSYNIAFETHKIPGSGGDGFSGRLVRSSFFSLTFLLFLIHYFYGNVYSAKKKRAVISSIPDNIHPLNGFVKFKYDKNSRFLKQIFYQPRFQDFSSSFSGHGGQTKESSTTYSVALSQHRPQPPHGEPFFPWRGQAPAKGGGRTSARLSGALISACPSS